METVSVRLLVSHCTDDGGIPANTILKVSKAEARRMVEAGHAVLLPATETIERPERAMKSAKRETR